MAKYFTADLHLNHANIIKLCNRPFNSCREMDEVIVERINERVKPKDELWVVGDFAFGKGISDQLYVQKLFRSINGHKHLVVGNHDPGWIRKLGWRSVHDAMALRDSGFRVFMFHYPLMTWPHIRRGAIHLFGHVHDNWPGSWHAVNVGVDWHDFRPLTLQEIAEEAERLPQNSYLKTLEPGLFGDDGPEE